jgi:transcription initiation factor TFIIE subunit beta
MFLQERTDSSGVQVKDLKDGWAECETPLSELEGARKILVIRTKKEGNPKHVFLDEPALSSEVDAEFRTMWMHVPVPKVDELPRKLTAVGQKPASDDPALTAAKVPIKQKQQKKRAARKVGRVTNTHMQDILKDFSHVKK